ncbi:MAG: terpene cyclase/mutase family protein [Lentisphaeria bacterium]|nr:terpene cyclase/mutase family protein [Lentisphaeria bacterium]
MVADSMEHTEPVALDIDAILEAYHRRQMVEHLIGPGVSLVVHVILVVGAALFFEPSVRRDLADIEVTIEEMEIKELDPKQLEELQNLEQLADNVVPTVEKPDVPQDVVEVATEDFSEDMASTDDAMDFSSVLDVRSNDTALKLPGLYGGRSNSGRREMIKKFGGSTRTETAVLRALRWLKETQNANGSWSKSEPDAMGGLGLLTFLAHGETPLSEEFGLTVQKAMKYLSDRMTAVDDSKTKYLGRAYTNGIATYALSEAYGLTKIPFLKPPMERGLGFIVEGQQKAGGFDYRYAKGARWDMSVTGWQVQAMKAGYVAGAEVPGLTDAIEKAIGFLKNVSYSNGQFGYSSPGKGSMGIQGAGTLSLQLLGEGDSTEVRKVADFIDKTDKVVWDDNKVYSAHNTPVYNWYYETQAMFHSGQTKWKNWNKTFSDTICNHQRSDGHWDSPGKDTWMEKDEKTGKMESKTKPEYDPWYATTLCCLSLQVYYRYLPTYKMPKSIAKSEQSVLEAIDEDLGIDLD